MTQHNPTVLVHGIASSKNEMLDLENYLMSQDIPTYNVEIGNGELTSIFTPMNEQCAALAEQIKKIGQKENTEKREKREIDIIAISQGGLLARCYVEKYTHLPEYPKVNTLLTMGTPHMGIYIPNSPDFYKRIVEDYWKDPFDYENYLKDNEFLAPLNNEKPHDNSEQYKNNILALQSFISVWSNIDDVIVPIQSATFEFYNATKALKMRELEIVPLKESEFFEDDKIGLKTLYDEKRFQNYNYDCQHNRFKTKECFIPILERVFL